MSTDPQTAGPHRSGPRARVAGLAAVLAIVAFAVLLVLVAVDNATLAGLDHRLETDVHGYAVHHRGFTSAMRAVSAIATPAAWWVVLVPLTIWLAIAQRWRAATFVPATFLGSIALNRVLKTLVDRPRPTLPHPVAHAAGASFPSGHAQAAAAGFGILLVLGLPLLAHAWRSGAIVVAAVGTATVSFSRIALGVHFLSDVVGGVLIGATWVLTLAAGFNLLGGRALADQA